VYISALKMGNNISWRIVFKFLDRIRACLHLGPNGLHQYRALHYTCEVIQVHSIIIMQYAAKLPKLASKAEELLLDTTWSQKDHES